MWRHLLLLLLITGCAQAPHYQTRTQFQPPDNPTGLACMSSCNQQLTSCQQSCTENYQSCVKQLKPDIDALYGQALTHYQNELEYYRMELERHHHMLQLRQMVAKPGQTLDPYFPPPMPPRAPIRESYAKQLKQQKCQQDCNCNNTSEGCYLACGASKITETTCLANCPAEEKHPNTPQQP